MTSHRNRPRSRSRSRGSQRRSGSSSHTHRSIPSTCMHCRFKMFKETNYGAAFCSMSVIILVFTALSETKWVYMEGGGCDHAAESFLKTSQFFFQGKFVEYESTVAFPVITAYQYGSSKTQVMVNCVTYSTVLYFKTIIALSFIVLMFTIAAFLLDLTGPSKKPLKLLKRNGFFSILSVIVCVFINFLCYYITVQLKKLQEETKFDKDAQVYVTCDLGFYFIAAAGGMSAFAAGFNCLKRHSSSGGYHEDRATLLDDCDNVPTMDMPESPEIIPSDVGQIPPLPSSPPHPPPEYTPL